MQYQCSSLFLFDYQMKRGGFVNIPYVFRKCTKCGEWLVANNSYFSKNKCGKYGFFSAMIVTLPFLERLYEYYKMFGL